MSASTTECLEHPLAPAMRPGFAPFDLEQHRRSMIRFATRLLRDGCAAEDAVQDTMLAALRSPQGFDGRSSFKTWLFAILKHKVLDIIRRRSRERPLDADDLGSFDDLDALFSDDGHWQRPPSDWGDPEAALTQREFVATLERCIDSLPKNTARVFMMREVMGMEIGDVCEAVGITRNNCAVILHRARMSLRNRLDECWFGTRAEGTR